jgi:sortase A
VIVRRVAGWAGELLVTLGVLVLLFAAWQLWWTDVVSNRAQTQIVDSLEATFAREGAEATSAPVPANGIPDALNDDGAFAVLRIPRFGDDYARPIIEGTGRDVLALGVGHYVGTAGPGQVGNFALAGTPHHLPVPSDAGAAPTAAVLTLTSCHPKFSATQRFVVHATLVESVPRAEWDPARPIGSSRVEATRARISRSPCVSPPLDCQKGRADPCMPPSGVRCPAPRGCAPCSAWCWPRSSWRPASRGSSRG